MDDREIKHWDKRLADQVKRGWDNYKHLHIDLGTARLDQSYLMTGEYLYVEESSSVNAIAKIKLNRKSNDALDLEKGVEIETVFIEIFITNDALQDEWLDLVFGINFKYKKKIAEGLKYVDRGDPAAPDFGLGDFTFDGGWHDLDLSGIIPENVKVLLFTIEINAGFTRQRITFRRKGMVNDFNSAYALTQAANIPVVHDLFVIPDSNRIIEYRGSAVAWNVVSMTIRGWFI